MKFRVNFFKKRIDKLLRLSKKNGEIINERDIPKDTYKNTKDKRLLWTIIHQQIGQLRTNGKNS